MVEYLTAIQTYYFRRAKNMTNVYVIYMTKLKFKLVIPELTELYHLSLM